MTTREWPSHRITKVDDHDFIRIPEAAKVYGCTRQNMRWHISKGNLKAYTRNGVQYVRESDVRVLAMFTLSRGTERGTKMVAM